jgi:predicted metal-binding membrane protein
MLDGALEQALRRDRALVIFAIASLTLLAWLYLWWLAAGMDGSMVMDSTSMDSMEMEGVGQVAGPVLEPWSAADFGFTFAMWAVMMVGMMAPSVAPIILLYARVAQQAADRGQPFASTTWFAAGYFAAWSAFGFFATLTQWLLEGAALLTPMMATNSALLGGGVLVAAGLYQWTPMKGACLSQCQSPLSFIQRHGGFRAAPAASLGLGARHGLYCVGCCWALMALLFVGGIMNLLWIAGISLLVLLEKVVSRGTWLSRAAGVVAVVAGIGLLWRGA